MSNQKFKFVFTTGVFGILDSDSSHSSFGEFKVRVLAKFDYSNLNLGFDCSSCRVPSPSGKVVDTVSRQDVERKDFCKICMENKPKGKMFDKNKCSHSYCSKCIGKHIAAKIQQNMHSVTCPDLNCKTVFDPDDCKSLVSKSVFDKWMNAICESVFPASEKFYCPFKDCSAMLVDDGGEVVTSSECPSCHRLFCAQCKVPWHADESCRKYQRSIKNKRSADEKFLKLATKNKWMKCPKCKFYVSRTEGCNHMSCRCGSTFCYSCGGNWSDDCDCDTDSDDTNSDDSDDTSSDDSDDDHC